MTDRATGTQARDLVLCADDYAQTEAVTAAILDLAAQGRLSATSVMVTSPRWPEDAGRLKPHIGKLAVGLHLNFSHGEPLGAMPRLAPGRRLPGVGKVILAALTGRLDAKEIAAEIERQLDAFEMVWGAPPDHVDGHQHVHVLPGIRKPLLRAIGKRWPGRRILVRVPSDSLSAVFSRPSPVKALIVQALATGFAREARKRGLAVNDGFSGFFEFGEGSYERAFARFADNTGRFHMIMCHPGLAAEGAGETDDPIAFHRPLEHRFFASVKGLSGRLWHPGPRQPGAPAPWPMVDPADA